MDQPLGVNKTTYTVVDFLEWQRQGSLDLQPVYQRRAVWNPKVKSLLIDSLLRGFPLPLVFLHNRLDVTTSKTIRQVVDGQQRLRTILSYVDIDSLREVEEWDRFTVMRTHNRDYAGLAFNQLPEDVQGRILQTELSVNVLPSNVDDVTVLSIFQRMNSTGLKLNDQEIRNATYFGEFKDSSYALAYSQNQRWQKWGVFSRQEVAQMKEVELTADLMGFLLRGVTARSKATINALYRDYDEIYPQREEVEQAFTSTFDVLEGVYGEGGSRSNLRRFRSTAWFYSVFAVASGEYGKITSRELVGRLEQVEVALRSDALDEDIAKILRGATADRASRKARIDFLASIQKKD
ncbi:DUF262 domain-containing protein [Kocuria sp. WN036]|uniref:DUF262 domain-containing protein n=1 Tax=Kocuria sp. WN036 TaxID=2032628 RepID=UPI00159546BD|nr:DUF262 domain-containing protein [Kocuria sp. WN036]